MNNMIYLIEGTIKSEKGKKSSNFTRAYGDKSIAFDFIHDFVVANSEDTKTKWWFDFENSGRDSITIVGEGVFYVWHDDKKKKQGTATLTLKEIYYISSPISEAINNVKENSYETSDETQDDFEKAFANMFDKLWK